MLLLRIRRPRLASPARCALLGLALLALARPAASQDRVALGGLAYLDYYHQLSSPDEAEEGLHGFTYRRIYLTADFRLSDAFDGRARLEMSESSLGTRGAVPFVKDLYLRWKVGGGHALTMGVAPTPVFGVTEDLWGYRALEETLLDLNDVASSRDFGLTVSGPVTPGGALRYTAMVANNEGVFPEEDAYKRAYGQLQARPGGDLLFALAGSYAGFEGVRERNSFVSALAGYDGEAVRAGVEAFVSADAFRGQREDATSLGVSAFGAVELSDAWALVVRADRVRREALAVPESGPASIGVTTSTLGLLGVDYRPHPQVHLIPNVMAVKADDEGTAAVLARGTLWFNF